MSIHNHSHDHTGKLGLAVLINVLLTIVQIIGGLLSGSLSLIADALHNLSDAGAIVVAIVARKIGNRPANEKMTYGYKRAEIIGALINSSTLIIIGIYLIFEAIDKYFNPSPIDGWIVFWVAGVALVIDFATAVLTYKSGAKSNMNIRAAFIHNVSDALASVVVIVAGILIILYEWYIVDVVATIGISMYVIYHGWLLIKRATLILMQAVPEDIKISQIKESLEQIDGVEEVYHIHVWQLDDDSLFFEGHVQIESCIFDIRNQLRDMLNSEFKITHSTIEVHLST